MAEEKKQDKKIIVDNDWKQEAKKEKDTLVAQEQAEKKEAPQQPRRGPLPKGDFAALVSMLVTQALFALGALHVEGQEDKKKEPDLAIAKYNIDMLETLEEKTKNNLTDQEKKVLEDTLSQVRMVYVQAAG